MATTNRKNANKQKIILSAIIALIIIISGIISERFFNIPSAETDNTVIDSSFSVQFIDVGQGDCTLIKTDKGNMLIDAGENGNESIILNHLAEQGVNELVYFIATHPHSDHIGGASEILNNIKVQNVIMPKLSASNTPTTNTYEKMLNSIKSSGAKVISATPGKSYTFGDVNFTILSPFQQDDNLNNMSVSVRLTYDKYSFMFTGDAEKSVEKQMLDSGYDLSADVYKLAHHGSSTSNTLEFMETISPKYAVISCAADNSYGHPHGEIVKQLNDLGIEYFSTYSEGTIVFTVGENGLAVNTIND